MSSYCLPVQPRAGHGHDEVRDGIAVRTGMDSRSELKFTDQTLARLGANTLFSFSEGTRNLNLQDGAMLLRVPKGAGWSKINSSAVTAAITGTTVMLETHASTKKNKNSYYKFIVLEGTAAALFARAAGGIDPGEGRANDHHAAGFEDDSGAS